MTSIEGFSTRFEGDHKEAHSSLRSNSVRGEKILATIQGVWGSLPQNILDIFRAYSEMNPEQLDFLQKHFVVYNPVTRTCSTDFSEFLDSQVILQGELHHSETLQTIQDLYWKLFHNLDSCTLVEGLLPGIAATEIPFWPSLPKGSLVVGSDSRGLTLNGYTQFNKDLSQRSNMREKAAAVFKRIAEHCNSIKFQTNNGKLVTFDSNLVKIESAITDLETNGNKQEKTLDRSRINFFRSNNSLLTQIVLLSSKFQKLEVVWGKNHFWDSDFCSSLDRANITYTILFPNEGTVEKVDNEVSWDHDRNVLELNITTSSSVHTLQVPKIFRSLFSTEIQKHMKDPIELQGTIVNSKLLSAIRGTVLTFAEKTSFLLETDSKDFFALRELYDVRLDNFDPKDKIAVQKILVSIFNSMLLFRNAMIDVATFHGTIIIDYVPHQLILKVTSDKPVTLKLKEDVLITSARYLLWEMRRMGLTTFTVPDRQILIFNDASKEECEAMKKTPSLIFQWLSKRAPKGTQINLTGALTIVSATYDDGIGIGLVSKGFTITLTQEAS